MAPRRHTARFVLNYFSVTLVTCAMLLTSQTEGRVVRVRRQGCQDGIYTHEGLACCKCGAGLRVEKHCTTHNKTKCVPCETGKEYQSHANNQETCEPCTSCSQPNANLEEERRCTAYVDSVCKCKKDHYCTSGTQPCKICEPCRVCGPEGLKVACSATSNTLCNELQPNDNTTAITLGILIPVIVVAVAGVLVFLWKKRKSGSKTLQNGNPDSVNMASLLTSDTDAVPAVILRPHIPDVAVVIGWEDMRNLAMQSNIPNGQIDACRTDFPNDSVERTINLLRIWEEKESKGASRKLIEYLQQNNKNSKAEKVIQILKKSENS